MTNFPSKPQKFHTHTALAQGLRQLFQQLQERLALHKNINVFLAGGMAVHLYTAQRVTTDVDAEFGSRIFIPSDLVVDVTLEDGTHESVYFDTNYNSTFALMHEDYLDDAIALDWGMEQIKLYVLSPLDLAVSKIARCADNDKEDSAALVRLGLTSADAIEQRAMAALAGYVGGQAMLLLNLRDAVALARQVEAERLPSLSLHPLNEGAVAVRLASGEPVGQFKWIGGCWKFKAMGYEGADLVPGGGPLTARHNCTLQVLDTAQASAVLLGPLAQ